jgi:hypothetical protein
METGRSYAFPGQVPPLGSIQTMLLLLLLLLVQF